ncbi:META domain-containing protein [Lysobacter sp. K5869]|uniref:META domain-containing protein n=1 Tax=Lysobacter sp. K5869 TaxID=2820808 RepID=UPI001C0641EE|nr:META domain-containing protein [Lysobacter sp. K5869]QWP77840.1 META domain-containing protein [Lysobacter sp. K5869]
MLDLVRRIPRGSGRPLLRALTCAAAGSVLLACAAAESGTQSAATAQPGETPPAAATLPPPPPMPAKPLQPPAPPLPAAPAANQGLEGYRWQVLTATGPDDRPIPELQPDRHLQIYLQFGPNKRLSITGQCGDMFGAYRIDGDRIEAPDTAQTTVGCLDARASGAATPARVHLSPPFRFALDGEGVRQRLRLTSSDGSRFVLQTTDAVWGARALPLVLEIAPDERNCDDVFGEPRCLWVRRLSTDAQLRPVSDWYRFADAIRDYRHRPGTHEALVLDYYAPPPGSHPMRRGTYLVQRTIPLAGAVAPSAPAHAPDTRDPGKTASAKAVHENR